MVPQLIIDAHSLKKSYHVGSHSFNALHLLNLQIYAGELVAIMGPSGSGKSTLMHILGCLDTPSEGYYSFNGQDVYKLKDRELSILRATQIGFIFQSFNLIAQLNIYENIEAPFLYHSTPVSPKERKERILSSIERVNLQHRLHHLPSQLSGGECQRVAIARALAINPLLILADEPTGNLDSETGESILHLFQELSAQGITCVIVTHDPKVATHCQRIVYMKDGSIITKDS